MDAFAPVPALAGGLLIGLASALLWIGNGRIAGISGIFGHAIPGGNGLMWRVIFLGAMIVGGLLAAPLTPILFGGYSPDAPQLVGTLPMLMLAGLLVGLGTRLGNGCTSGHGVCGLARFSGRSLVNVAIFFGVAMLTVAILGVQS